MTAGSSGPVEEIAPRRPRRRPSAWRRRKFTCARRRTTGPILPSAASANGCSMLAGGEDVDLRASISTRASPGLVSRAGHCLVKAAPAYVNARAGPAGRGRSPLGHGGAGEDGGEQNGVLRFMTGPSTGRRPRWGGCRGTIVRLDAQRSGFTPLDDPCRRRRENRPKTTARIATSSTASPCAASRFGRRSATVDSSPVAAKGIRISPSRSTRFPVCRVGKGDRRSVELRHRTKDPAMSRTTFPLLDARRLRLRPRARWWPSTRAGPASNCSTWSPAPAASAISSISVPRPRRWTARDPPTAAAGRHHDSRTSYLISTPTARLIRLARQGEPSRPDCLWVMWSRLPARRSMHEREIERLGAEHLFGDHALTDANSSTAVG